MTLLTSNSVLAIKTEVTPGTAETLTGAEAVYNILDAQMNATIPISVRQSQGSMTKIAGVPGARQAVCTFNLEMTGDGAGGVPAWATTLLAACGLVNTTGTLTPRSEAPGANVKTVTIGLYENGRRKLMVGAVGNVSFPISPGSSVIMAFSFTGVWAGVSDVAILAPTYPTIVPIRASSGICNINSVAQTFATATLDLGNVIAVRPSIATESGFAHAIITNRAPMWTIDPEAKLVAGGDVFGDWQTGTARALSLVFANDTDSITFGSLAAQRMTVGDADREGLRVDSQTLQCCRTGSNPELSILFDGP